MILATGVDWRRLGVASLEALVGTGVFYGAATSEAQAMKDERVFVVGGATPLARRRCTWPATPPRSPCWSAGRRWPRPCPTTWSASWRRRPTSPSTTTPRPSRATAMAGSPA